MANTITFNLTMALSATKAHPSMSVNWTAVQIGSNFTMETQNIGTSESPIDIGTAIGTLGYLIVQNLDTTNPIDIALDSGITNKIATLAAGHGALVPVPAGATLYAKATGGTVQIQFLAIEL